MTKRYRNAVYLLRQCKLLTRTALALCSMTGTRYLSFKPFDLVTQRSK